MASDITRRESIAMLGAGLLTACSRQPAEKKRSAAVHTPSRREVVQATRALKGPPWPTRDPFLFCVYHLDRYPRGTVEMAPEATLDGRRIGQDFAGKDGWNMYHGRRVPGFPQHPHRGFETVTVVRKGLVDHSDSLGATARYGQGDTQWLTAGGGIQHAEMFPLINTETDNPLDLYQIWLNLPARNKMVPPHFKMLWSKTIPRATFDGGVVLTTIAGRHENMLPPAPPPNSWAADPDNALAMWTITMPPRARWRLPAVPSGVARSLYIVSGSGLGVSQQSVRARSLVELADALPADLENGDQTTELLLLQGRPIGEPVAKRGPFVMNSGAEIRQAYEDYSTTRFGGWPWPDRAPVHPRGQGRFARHADGREEVAG